MRAFSFFAAAALAAVVSAGSTDNAFNNPEGGYTFTAGKSTTLTWKNDTSGTVSLRLQTGKTTTADSGTEIASHIKNSGSYTWEVPDDLEKDRQYTVEIINDSDPESYNFAPYFTVAGATGTGSSTATSSASASSSAESTSATSTPESTASASSTDAASTTTGGGSSTMTTMTTTASPSSSSASSTAASSASASSSQSSSAASSSTSETSVPTNGAMANHVSGSMLAIVAGAIALM
ncbi:hypothetical protein N7492_003641 [Penicillium capsulatum]|uniref:Yeast cell wall synthesis Kre9/Knh1-like N-terminal domain-containing protein n=1 Tax=Penicillium capsulatum TaxID=69766 RepID=A0A9W9LWA4_9EURO|nr:hypothetical protein N7492_003641 [Penicillium capsulatum]KAJ6121778.1 hypothetical protein N7512_004243 [Penicillium capsulatum]